MKANDRAERAKLVRRLHDEGMSPAQIASMVNVSVNLVHKILANITTIDANWERKVIPPVRLLKDEIRELRVKGKTYSQIGRELGMKYRGKPYSYQTVWSCLNGNDKSRFENQRD
jgi:DNA invertase Pin-like site-specific DNA recombinase